jgi:hypothetical protein
MSILATCSDTPASATARDFALPTFLVIGLSVMKTPSANASSLGHLRRWRHQDAITRTERAWGRHVGAVEDDVGVPGPRLMRNALGLSHNLCLALTPRCGRDGVPAAVLVPKSASNDENTPVLFIDGPI